MVKKRADKEFVRIVREKLKDHLKKIMLFGSYARGEQTEDSDIDILVVVDKKEKHIQEMILDACVE